MSRMAVTRYLALAFIFVATATAQDDFWPPFQVKLLYFCVPKSNFSSISGRMEMFRRG